MCQIWLGSDGGVEKNGGTDKGTLQLYIVEEGNATVEFILLFVNS